MPATLASVIATAIAALRAIRYADKAIPLVRWHGPFRGASRTLLLETFSKPLTLALAWERTRSENDVETLSGDDESVRTVGLVVYVVEQDPRGAGHALRGDAALLGMDVAVPLVEGALHGLGVPSPPATLRFAVTGTPDAAVTLGTSLLRVGTSISYRPLAASPTITLDGSGNGAVDATCITPGVVGNAPPGLDVAWDATPTDLNTAAMVYETVVEGQGGLLRSDRIQHVGSDPLALDAEFALYVSAVHFTARTAASDTTNLDALLAIDPLAIAADVNRKTDETPPNPAAVFTVDTT